METTAAKRKELSRKTRSVTRLLLVFRAFLFRLHERHRQRISLSELDDHLLDDIGLTPADVRRECAKPFWR